jgi:arabinose-5-phosphate isomerase
MKEAIIEISSKRMGMSIVVDSDAKLHGIITDGDLRRGLEKWGEKFLSHRAEDVMTPKPRTISGNVLAAKVLSIMEEHSITSLIVLGQEERIEGIVHLHDLLRSGIV